jgi:hypothetical protein
VQCCHPVAGMVKEHPYLTAEEMEQQYRSVISKAVQARNQQDTGRHLGTVRRTRPMAANLVALLQQHGWLLQCAGPQNPNPTLLPASSPPSSIVQPAHLM